MSILNAYPLGGYPNQAGAQCIAGPSYSDGNTVVYSVDALNRAIEGARRANWSVDVRVTEAGLLAVSVAKSAGDQT